jgi:hypothetical protein
MRPFGENEMPQVSQPAETYKSYGYKIRKIKAEEIRTEKGQNQQRRPEEKTGRPQ